MLFYLAVCFNSLTAIKLALYKLNFKKFLKFKAVMTSSRLSTVAENGYAALEINPVKMFDKGEYTIVAVNTLGEARQSATINVIGQPVSIRCRKFA